MPRLFCFGLGYTATRLALRVIARGWQVAGTCSGPEKQAELDALGIEAHRFDEDRPLADPDMVLAGTTHLLASVPPVERDEPSGDTVLDHHRDAVVRIAGLSWAGYLSTASVYGDHEGAWVDEGAETTPSGACGQRRLKAEEAWLALWYDHGVPVHIFRLSGIYGPGRSAIDQVRNGRAQRIHKPGHVFNRMHVDDAVAVLQSSMARPNPGAVYNCSDDEPVPSEVVVAHAYRLLDMPVPPLVPFFKAELSPLAESLYADNTRLSNRRIKEELGIQLSYPSYREGLASQLAAERPEASRTDYARQEGR